MIKHNEIFIINVNDKEYAQLNRNKCKEFSTSSLLLGALWVKTIDHGAYGAKYIYQLYGETTGVKKLVCDIVAEAVAYHHGGLPDNLAEDNTVPLFTRLEKISDDELEYVVKVFYEEKGLTAPLFLQRWFNF